MDEAAKKILIVDDEKALAHALELKLGFLKYDVTVANDGNAALEILKSQKLLIFYEGFQNFLFF